MQMLCCNGKDRSINRTIFHNDGKSTIGIHGHDCKNLLIQLTEGRLEIGITTVKAGRLSNGLRKDYPMKNIIEMWRLIDVEHKH